MKVLIDLPYCRFLYRGSAKTIIAFSAIGCPKGKFHGSNALQSTDSNLLLVNCPRNSWYLDGIPGMGDSPESAAEGIARALNAHGLSLCNATAWGGSMGGYGAVVLGSLMGAGRIVATGAELALLVPGGNSELILKKIQKRPIIDFPDIKSIVASTSSSIWLYAGEFFYPDLVSAKLIMNLPNVKVTTLRNFGHALPAYIHKRYGLDSFINSHDRIEHPFYFEDGEAGNISSFSRYWENLHFASLGYSKEFAIIANLSCVGHSDWKGHCHYALSLGASALGFSEEALKHAMFAHREQPKCSFIIERLAIALRDTGAPANEWLEIACSIQSLNKPELFQNGDKLLEAIANGFIKSNLHQQGVNFFKEQIIRPDTNSFIKSRFFDYLQRVRGGDTWSIAFSPVLESNLLGKLIDKRLIVSNGGNSCVSGVMLFHKKLGQPVDFEAEGLEIVNWDNRIASPGFGKMYIGHPEAAFARFRFRVRLGLSDTALINARWRNGRKSPALIFQRLDPLVERD